VVRIFTLCLSFALAVLGFAGLYLNASPWLIAIDFVAAAVGVGLDIMLWATQGRFSIIVAFAMACGLTALFFAGVVADATPWLCWTVFAIAVLFFAIGCARAFARTLSGGEIRV
jgi:hypothetical protein